MSGSSHPVIQLGLDLLKEKSIEPHLLEKYTVAFSLLDIDISTGLKLAGLRSIFSDPTDSTTAANYYLPCKLDPKTINYPDQDVEPSDFENVRPPKTSSQNLLVQLERYGSFVATSADPQIPVYDLFKSVAAVHDCLGLKQCDEEFDKKCMLVGCDFSGIQDTVYTISSKGALKTLRARSFMLEMLTEHIIYEILSLAKAERHAVIYSGGGGFGLLLPNKKGLKKDIGKFGDLLNEWAYSEFFGKLFIALDVLPFGKEKLESAKEFKELRQEQSDNLDKQKRRKFLKQLDSLFEPKMPKQTSVQTECQITRRDDLPNDKMRDLESGQRMPDENPDRTKIWVSESSYRQFRLGDKLLDAKYVCRRKEAKDHKSGFLVFPKADSSSNNLIFAYYVVSDRHIKNSEFVWNINQWQCDENEFLMLYGNYVRNVTGLPASIQPHAYERYLEEHGKEMKRPKQATANFEDLSECSCGADLIGSLRMDVDNMGKLFADIGNLSELSTKSRMLNLFFKVYLNRICTGNLDGGLEPTDIVGKNYTEKNKGRNVSVVYAGGDDLFILGAWDETTELAFDIHRCFALCTGGRGISGGLTLHQPKFPLYQMARKSGEAEHVAKHDRDVIHDDPTKNRIALFYDDAKDQRKSKMQNSERYMLSMTWGLSNVFLLPLMETYRECGDLKIQDGRCVLEIEKFSYQTIEKWFAIIKKYQERNQLYLPTMARVMSQVEEGLGEENSSLFKDLVGFLYTNDESKKDWISHLHVALNWLSYLRREK